MKRLFLVIALLLYAAPAFADCLELPVINTAKKGRPPDYDPAIPPGLAVALDYVTDGIPTVKGVAKFATVITCFRDSVTFPAKLGPMTRDQAATIIHNRDPAWKFNPDSLKVAEKKTALQNFIDRAWQVALRYLDVAIAWAASSTDNFNRADGADLGAAWDPYDNPSATNCQILGNQVTNVTSPVDCVEGYSTLIPGANQYTQFTIPIGFTSTSPGSLWVSAIVRLHAPPEFSGYYCRAQPDLETFTSRIRRADASSNSTLLNDTTNPQWAPGDTVRCEVSGNVITMKKNGVTIFSKDDPASTYASGRGGININDDPAFILNPIDDFEVGDLGAAPTVPRHKPLVIQ